MESTKANLKNVPSIIFTTLAKVGWGFLGQHPFRGQGWKPCSLTEAAMYSCVGCWLCKGHLPASSLFSDLWAICFLQDHILQEEKVFSKSCQEALWVVGTGALTVPVTLIQAPVHKQVLSSLKECHRALNVFPGWFLVSVASALAFSGREIHHGALN